MVAQPSDGADSAAPDPVAAYWTAVTDLRATAHNPSWRALEASTARNGHRVPNSTLQGWFDRRTVVPDRPGSDALLTALGADPRQLHTLWSAAYNAYRTPPRRAAASTPEQPEPPSRWPLPAAAAVMAATILALLLTRPAHLPKRPVPTSSAASAQHAAHADYYRTQSYLILTDDVKDDLHVMLRWRIAHKELPPAYNLTGYGTSTPIRVPTGGQKPGAPIEYQVCIGSRQTGPRSCGPWTLDRLP